MTRVLLVTPYSSLTNRGGAEVAAERLAAALGMVDDSLRVTKLSGVPEGALLGGVVERVGDDSFVLAGGYGDQLRFTSRRGPWENRALTEWLRALAPEVVHFHHFVGIGTDLIPVVQQALPGTRTVFTAHEFLASCARDGKMVRSDGRLCEQGSNFDCAQCVGAAPVDIFLRDDFFGRLLSSFNAVISPSRFVAGRLAAWRENLPLTVIPNCPAPPHDPNRTAPPGSIGERLTIGFFGQVIPTKGLHILLDALIRLRKSVSRPVELLVFGTRPDEAYWSEQIEPRLGLLRKGMVQACYMGAYEHAFVGELMELVDWVAVPSLWWENAPNVIFEAYAAGRPVIGGNVGGMREAIEETGAGVTVTVGSVAHWSRVLADLASTSGDQSTKDLADKAQTPWTAEQIARRHLAIYGLGG